MDRTSWRDDPALAPIIAAVQADPESEGLLLGGSRGAGVHDHESDYDLEWVLSDAAYDRRQAAGELMHHPLDPRFEVGSTCPRELAAIRERANWELPAYATAVVLVDCHGRLEPLLQTMATMSAERADAEVLAWFDGYLNGFYRSLKAWRRGNALGGQLQAAESLMHLVKVLFALERRWPPYHDRLASRLADLDGQGWPPGYLAATLLRIAQTGDPTLQQELEARAEALVQSRGYDVDLWDGEIDRVKAWSFAGR